jgi:coenzyme F420-reducing hydrogenase delta subunit
MQSDNNIIALVQVLKKWSKKVILYAVLAGILAVIASLFLPNYYRSTTVFYPANISLSNPNPLGFADKNRYPFGEGDDVDRMLSIATSLDFKNKIITKYQLDGHYKLTGQDDKSKLAVLEEFSDLYVVKKNKYDAIEISYEDQDKVLAAKVTNDAREMVGSYLVEMLKTSNQSQVVSMQASIQTQEDQAKALALQINTIKSDAEIVQSGTQGAELAERLVEAQAYLDFAKGKVAFYANKPAYKDSLIKYQAVTNGYQSMLARMRNQSKTYSQAINEIEKKEAEYNQLVNQLAVEKEKLKQILVVQTNPNTVLHTIEQANVALKKSRPMRSLIVLSTMIVVGFVTLALALFIESDLFQSITAALKQ